MVLCLEVNGCLTAFLGSSPGLLTATQVVWGQNAAEGLGNLKGGNPLSKIPLSTPPSQIRSSPLASHPALALWASPPPPALAAPILPLRPLSPATLSPDGPPGPISPHPGPLQRPPPTSSHPFPAHTSMGRGAWGTGPLPSQAAAAAAAAVSLPRCRCQGGDRIWGRPSPDRWRGGGSGKLGPCRSERWGAVPPTPSLPAGSLRARATAAAISPTPPSACWLPGLARKWGAMMGSGPRQSPLAGPAPGELSGTRGRRQRRRLVRQSQHL